MTSIETQILLHDQTLSMLREFWMEASPADKPKYQNKIDTALDHRIKLMQARDSQGQ